jgi:hypothetical protein
VGERAEGLGGAPREHPARIGAGLTAPDARPRALWAAAAAANLFLLWHFHDRYWYPTDDGFYAHIAERLLNGEVLNRDVQDIHPGYIHAVHVLAFRLFGTDMVSLRYPLVLVAFLQACNVFVLLQRRDAVLAAAASVAAVALGVLQFVDPNPNWYGIALATFLASWMIGVPDGHRWRLAGAGFLAGLLTMFRHLTGAWVAMAVLALALLEHSARGSRAHSVLAARGLVAIMLGGILGYLALSPETEPGGLVLMAAWPIAILVWLLVRVRATNAQTASIVVQVAGGGLVAALPLILYHVVHGSLVIWLNDVVLAPWSELELPFYGNGWYALLPIAALYQTLTSFDAVQIANGLYWVVLPVLSAVNGWLVLRRLAAGAETRELVLPVIASFHALTALLLEGPLYLYYSVGLSQLAVLWSAAAASRPVRWASTAATCAIAVVAVVFHAGQSRNRTPVQILQGQRISPVWMAGAGGLERARLRLDPADRDIYGRLVGLIETETGVEDSILAIPNDAELYFLARRRNPLRFYNSALGIKSEADLDAVLAELHTRPPRLVAFRPDDKYNNAASHRVMDLVRSRYDRIDTIAGLDIYRLR